GCVVVRRPVRGDGGDRRPGLVRARPGRGDAGRRAPRARAGAGRRGARDRPRPHREGARMTLRRLGPAPERFAARGGPVRHRAAFVYQIESFRYWERELGRDDFAYGQFGENLTVEGLADDAVCIGDRYRIGGALFEVTQPRVTCYRVGIRMDDPAMPALLVSHRRPGFYLRVLEEGDVEAGDRIVKVAAGTEQMTVAEVDGLLYTPG